MRTLLIVVLIVSGLLFTGAVLMMSPKWWLGAWIAGFSGSSWGDYGSKKSVESTLKKVAYLTSVVFVITSILLPYVSD